MLKRPAHRILPIISALCILAACGGGGVQSAGNAPPGGSPDPGPAPSPGTGSATLTWAAPTGRIDGDPAPLSEISGYKIYFGTSATDTSSVITVPGGTSTQHQLTDLVRGMTYYFRMSAYDVQGIEGVVSDAQSFLVPNG